MYRAPEIYLFSEIGIPTKSAACGDFAIFAIFGVRCRRCH